MHFGVELCDRESKRHSDCCPHRSGSDVNPVRFRYLAHRNLLSKLETRCNKADGTAPR